MPDMFPTTCQVWVEDRSNLGERLSFRDKKWAPVSTLIVCLLEVAESPSEHEAKTQPLPLTNCANLGKSLEHLEAVYSSAKWAHTHTHRGHLLIFTERGHSHVRKCM